MLPIFGAIAGGLAGGQTDNTYQRLNMTPSTKLENFSLEEMLKRLQQMSGMVDAGPGQQDIGNALTSQRGLADMLKMFTQNGGIPSADEMKQGMEQAKIAFSGQRVAIDQAMQEGRQQANQRAAVLGRSQNDPMLAGLFNKQRAQAYERLGAQENEFAFQMPQRKLGFAAQLADVQGGLASQAMANRQALFALGNQSATSERNFRLASAEKQIESGGGFKGAVTGMFGGASMGMGLPGGGMGGASGANAGVQAMSTFQMNPQVQNAMQSGGQMFALPPPTQQSGFSGIVNQGYRPMISYGRSVA